MKIEKRLRDFLHLKRTVLYKWAVHTTVCVPPPLYIYIYIYISYIKCNVVTLDKRILTCLIIYTNANLTFLTLFVKYVFEKNYKFYVEKIMKKKNRLRDFLHLKRTKLKQLYVWYCTNELYIQLYVWRARWQGLAI
jgi:hypothetical protein